jgi:hydroxymethylpyrimidine pyrophosphatase-like HAD family hydrolase
MIYIFDLDNTLCYTKSNEYTSAQPISKNIKKVNQLYNRGNKIKIYTGRGYLSGLDWREVTFNQLKNWGVKFHELIMDKPDYDLFVDDKCINTKDFFK